MKLEFGYNQVAPAVEQSGIHVPTLWFLLIVCAIWILFDRDEE